MIDLHDDLAAALAQRYAIERELGHGGMAIVYLARDLKHSRRVAVKVLRPDLASSIGGERFLREIAVAARLTHPNILALYDSGDADGLLYYVMPFIEGETLRARLDREHQLPVDEALAIARQIAAALDYAHSQGVVHRDVKPENILIAGDHVCVADFGLARALYTASTQRLTESAVAVGTPAYMSPEQAAADPDVDSRADVYSLGCVVYEMLAGVPPFKGATAQAVLAQHLTATPPSICAQRPHSPKAIDAAVQKAMEKIPADRFRTAGEFVRAMEGARPAETPHETTAVPRRNSPATRIFVVGVGAALATAIAIIAGWRFAGHRAPLNAHTFAVLSFPQPRAIDSVAGRLADALAEWDGVRVVDARQTAEALRGRSLASLSTRDVADVGRSLGAGRVVWGDVLSSGDSVTIRATLYDAVRDSVVRTVKLTTGARGPTTQQYRSIANRFLRDRADLPWKSESGDARPALTAWTAFDSARASLSRWNLDEAEQQLREAVTEQDDFPEAQLWLAVVGSWKRQPVAAWLPAARRALERTTRLDTADSLLALGQTALGEFRFSDACDAFRRYVALDTLTVAGWYGLGECQASDSVVIPDRSSPTGYRFRSSLQGAVRAYMRAAQVAASPPPFVLQRIASVLFTEPNHFRNGQLQGGGTLFAAYPSLEHDTLAFVPAPLAAVMSRAEMTPHGRAAAIERNRATVRRLYEAWVRSMPTSLEAHVALAGLLEVTEDLAGSDTATPSALGEAHRALALTRDEATRASLAADELRLLIKNGDWEGAAALADSLFTARPMTAADTSLAGAAVLTGRIRTAGQLLRAGVNGRATTIVGSDGQAMSVPAAVALDVATVLPYAALGACTPLLRDFAHRLDRRLESYVPVAESRAPLRIALLRRPLSLAQPCLGAAAMRGIPPGGDPAVMLQTLLSDGDIARIRTEWRRVSALRSAGGVRPGDVAVDYTYLESALLAQVGDTAAAVRHLDQTLEALPTLGVYVLRDPAQSGGLVRAMELRAELAARAGDSAVARQWARAVTTLWHDADPELAPRVRRMQAIAGRLHP